MIQLKLKLNSKKSTTVYATNGKSYILNPGSNVINLEYEDYLSLAKALCIKPVDNKKNEDKAPAKEDKKPEIKDTPKEEPVREEAPAEPEKVEELTKEKEASVEDAKVEEQVPKEEPVEEAKAEEVEDYSIWTLKQLKAKYKEITGESCKLKKDEVISFLQEHQSNA